ncbi:hypothetical protein [Streptomyces cinereoruber]|uniref:hypothetical protein n=1 Tax=Streptomyces cinereoruber TaxID=67260 RepID=UPI00364545AD
MSQHCTAQTPRSAGRRQIMLNHSEIIMDDLEIEVDDALEKMSLIEAGVKNHSEIVL